MCKVLPSSLAQGVLEKVKRRGECSRVVCPPALHAPSLNDGIGMFQIGRVPGMKLMCFERESRKKSKACVSFSNFNGSDIKALTPFTFEQPLRFAQIHPHRVRIDPLPVYPVALRFPQKVLHLRHHSCKHLFTLAIASEPLHYRWIKKGCVGKNKISGLWLMIGCQNKRVWANVLFVRLPYSPAAIALGMFPRPAYPYDISCSHLLLCEFFQKKIRYVKIIP